MKFALVSLMLSLGFIMNAEEKPKNSQIPVIQPAYIGKAYTFSGTVETQSEGRKSITKFAGKTTTASFECTWEDMRLGMKGSVRADKDGGVLRMAGLPEQKIKSPEMAIASATGISAGAAHVMYNLWKGNSQIVFPAGDFKVSKTGDVTEYSGSSPSLTTVVLMKDLVIQSITTTSKPHQAKEIELTDKDIKEALRAMGKPDTQEEIDKLRATLKEANEAMKMQKDPVIWITKFTIEGATP